MNNQSKIRLLISVRTAAEALEALAGGADLIDVKEPRNGPLGRAEAETVEAVVRAIAGRVPVSAALGELHSMNSEMVERYAKIGLRFLKVGLFACRTKPWRKMLEAIQLRLGNRTALVPTAYAASASVEAPPIDDVFDFAVQNRFSHFLLDTYEKNGQTLLDYPEAEQFLQSVDALQTSTGIKVAVAGSLRLSQIPCVLGYRPAWIAVRGAACRDGQRDHSICGDRVRELAEHLQPRLKDEAEPISD